MTRADLEMLWTQVRRCFETATHILPHSVRPGDEGGTLEGYRGWLEHNELELAFVELEMLGEANETPDPYWLELATAASLMGLDAHEARCRSRVRRVAG